jgi:hypothetical protein
MGKNNQATDRMIITTYYEDEDKLLVAKTIRSKYVRLACMRAFDNMSMNMYGARICVVYDDELGKDHAAFVLHVDGRVETIYKRDQTNPKLTKFGSFRLQDPKIVKEKLKKGKK